MLGKVYDSTAIHGHGYRQENCHGITALWTLQHLLNNIRR